MIKYTSEEMDLLTKMWLDGESYGRIAVVLKRTRSSVASKCNSLGLIRAHTAGKCDRYNRHKKHDPLTLNQISALPPPRKRRRRKTVKEPVVMSTPMRKKRKRLPSWLRNQNHYEPLNKQFSRPIEDIPEMGKCKYIKGDPRDKENARWCGRTVLQGSYCAKHHAKMYTEYKTTNYPWISKNWKKKA